MTVATTTTFNLDNKGIIDLAIERIGGEETTGYDARSGRLNLNLLMQDLNVRNDLSWPVELRSFTLTQSDGQYTLGTDIIDILDMYVTDTSQTTLTDLPVQRISRAKYALIADKTTEGLPIQCYVDRQRDAPVINLYQLPDLTTYDFSYYILRQTFDVGTPTNNLDSPVRWLPCIVSGLAFYLGRGRRLKLGIEFVNELRKDFELDYGIAIASDADGSALRLQPDLSMYFR